jgi:hypothetical protein
MVPIAQRCGNSLAVGMQLLGNQRSSGTDKIESQGWGGLVPGLTAKFKVRVLWVWRRGSVVGPLGVAWRQRSGSFGCGVEAA